MPAPRKRANPRLIKLHRPYSIDEAARTLGTHKNTVRSWIKDGLQIADCKRPTLILGHDLRRYLENKRKAAKRPCAPGEFYCFKCRQPMRPALAMVECRPRNGVSGDLKGCGGWMHRAARLAAISAIMPNIDVQIVEAEARIRERTNPSLNCDIQED